MENLPKEGPMLSASNAVKNSRIEKMSRTFYRGGALYAGVGATLAVPFSAAATLGASAETAAPGLLVGIFFVGVGALIGATGGVIHITERFDSKNS